MADRIDLEDALTDVEGAMAVLGVLALDLLSHNGQKWTDAGAEPQPGMCLSLFTDEEWRALYHSVSMMRGSVEKLSAAFYERPA